MQRLTTEQRANIVRAAREWLGTPYHHHARVKHAGADCAMFPLAVYQECGVLPREYMPPHYSVQWHLHRSEELYLNELEKFVVEIDSSPQPADFVVFQVRTDVFSWGDRGGMANRDSRLHSARRSSKRRVARWRTTGKGTQML